MAGTSPAMATGWVSGSRRLVASLGALRPARVRRGVVLGGRIDQRNDLVLDRLDPVGRLDPLGAVPLHHEHAVVAVVVAARDAERGGEAVHAELLEARLGDVERLEAAPHV